MAKDDLVGVVVAEVGRSGGDREGPLPWALIS